MTLYNKVKWVLGILMVFLLILSTNLIDRNNFTRLKESVESIYEDRLIAKDLIFEISRVLQEKELALMAMDTAFFNQENETLNGEIQAYISRYGETKLTAEEGQIFAELKADLETLSVLENKLADPQSSSVEIIEKQITKSKEDLYKLSKIQLHEAGRQVKISKNALDTVELFTQLEIYLLIFLAIVIQIIVMYKPKKEDE